MQVQMWVRAWICAQRLETRTSLLEAQMSWTNDIDGEEEEGTKVGEKPPPPVTRRGENVV